MSRVHETRNTTEGNLETAFYIAENFGIIRKELNEKVNKNDPDDWQVWDLIRSKIIQ